MSYNIAHGRGQAHSNWGGGSASERLARLKAIGECLIELDSDIVVLNEVDFDCSWSHGINQAEFLAKYAGYKYYIEQRNYDFCFLAWSWKFGNAVLSKYEIKSYDELDLPAFSRWESWLAGKKSGIDCVVKVGKRPVRILAVHLSQRSAATRKESAEQMISLAQNSSFATILAGDLNSSFKATGQAQKLNAIQCLERHFGFRNTLSTFIPADCYSYKAYQQKRLLDWIVVDSPLSYISYQIVPIALSDHLPVQALIKVN